LLKGLGFDGHELIIRGVPGIVKYIYTEIIVVFSVT
jgi:hypothetical protein